MHKIKLHWIFILLFAFCFLGSADNASAGGTMSPGDCAVNNRTSGNCQNRINELLASGGTVTLASGEYWINNTITMRSGNVLTGSGAIIRLVDHANWPINRAMIYGSGVSDVRITGFEIDGNRGPNETSNGADTSCGLYYYTMIHFVSSSNIEVDSMYMHHNWNDILKIQSCTNVSFHDNNVRQPGHDIVYAIHCTNVYVYNNIMGLYCNSGARADGTRNFQVYNNRIFRDVGAGGYAGIEVQGSSTVYQQGNTFGDTSHSTPETWDDTPPKGGMIADLAGGAATIVNGPPPGGWGTGPSGGTTPGGSASSCPTGSTLAFSSDSYQPNATLQFSGSVDSGNMYLCIYRPNGTLATGGTNGLTQVTAVGDANGTWTGVLSTESSQCSHELSTASSCRDTAQVGTDSTSSNSPEYWDPTDPILDPNPFVYVDPALPVAERDVEDLFPGLTSSPNTATDACISDESQAANTAGMVPCGKHFDDPATAWNECEPCRLCHLVLMGQLVMEFLIRISAIAATLAIIVSGLLYIFAAGRTGLVAKSKTMIKYTLLGFIIVFIAWAIVNTVLTVTGYISPMGGTWHTMC